MLRFYWLRDTKRNPVAVIASEVETRGSASVVKFSLAVHNPKDKFNKQIGRAVAEGRLRKTYGILPLNDKVKVQMMACISEDPSLPNRVRRAAEAWYQRWQEQLDTHADEIADARKGHP